jgi:DNA-binding transcriptional MerR regulator
VELVTTRLFGVSEATRELGISEAWLRRAEETGRIPKAQRDMNRWRVYTEKDIAMLRQMPVPTPPEAQVVDK